MRIKKAKSCKSHLCDYCQNWIKSWDNHMHIDDIKRTTPVMQVSIRVHLDCWRAAGG